MDGNNNKSYLRKSNKSLGYCFGPVRELESWAG